VIIIATGAWAILRPLLSFGNTFYACSNRRVMIRSGIIETIIKIIDYDEISDMQVTVNLFEKMSNAGTIRFFSGRTQTDSDNNVTTKVYEAWEAINDPYAVFKKVKQIAVDIKTDYNYPNALRPDTNPGYTTKYEPEK
jgi:type I site-specific restriction endonuclease